LLENWSVEDPANFEYPRDIASSRLSAMTRMGWIAIAAAAGCAPTDAAPASKDVAVELAAVTLGEDCGATPALTPPAGKADADEGKARAPSCVQTSMQLSVKAPADGAKATEIRIAKVELFEAGGKVALETLTAKQPSKWDGKRYVAWNQSAAAGETLATSYVLSSPNWGKHTKGRWNAHTKTFHLRVTVSIGTATRTIEKQATAVAQLPPEVDT
jgi:hypothetical protein